MKLSELIDALKKLQEEFCGDLPVRLQTDQGQHLMSASWCGINYIESEEYLSEGIAGEDLSEYPDAIKVVEIQAF